MRYDYHNRIKQRIRAGELIDAYRDHNYPRIGEALVLVFCTEPVKRPIRPHRWDEYRELLERMGQNEHENEKHRYDAAGGWTGTDCNSEGDAGSMDIREDDRMEFWVTEDGLMLKKAETRCAVCGGTDVAAFDMNGCKICRGCAKKIAERLRRGE